MPITVSKHKALLTTVIIINMHSMEFYKYK